jgi:hypothetical protein
MIDTKHPQYTEALPDWTTMSDCYAGQRQVKAQGKTYLPPTSGMIATGFGKTQANGLPMPGQAAYDAYRMRANFHEFVRDAIDGMVGIIHRKPPTIELPARIEMMLKNATRAHEPIATLWRRITQAQLKHGRIGLLVDIPHAAKIKDAIPYIATYDARTIINWDAGEREQGRHVVEFVVLDESGPRRRGSLQWVDVVAYRLSALSEMIETIGASNQEAMGAGVYVTSQIVMDGDDARPLAEANFVAPAIAGTQLQQVPFVFVNSKDLVPEPDLPPLLGLGNLALSIYRSEADYRQSLFMQGQDTFVRVGAKEDAPPALGGGAVVDVPIGGDAKYVGVSSSGLSEQRQALENDMTKASQQTINMLDTKSGSAESGDALRIRVASRTATLSSIVTTGAQGLRDALSHAARWMGASESEIEAMVVEGNTDFSDHQAEPTALGALMSAVASGAPLSLKTIHDWARDNELTTLSFEEEMALIEGEMSEREPPAPEPPPEPPLDPDDPRRTDA